jgi:hypothetical protein
MENSHNLRRLVDVIQDPADMLAPAEHETADLAPRFGRFAY